MSKVACGDKKKKEIGVILIVKCHIIGTWRIDAEKLTHFSSVYIFEITYCIYIHYLNCSSDLTRNAVSSISGHDRGELN